VGVLDTSSRAFDDMNNNTSTRRSSAVLIYFFAGDRADLLACGASFAGCDGLPNSRGPGLARACSDDGGMR
jgi:hypothetical protein